MAAVGKLVVTQLRAESSLLVPRGAVGPTVSGVVRLTLRPPLSKDDSLVNGRGFRPSQVWEGFPWLPLSQLVATKDLAEGQSTAPLVEVL